jgi:putative membrane protein
MSQKENSPPKTFKPDLKERDAEEVGAQLSSQRTGMSFQRTRLSADRTLMSVIRTSLSLIGFGFTVFQFFQHLHQGKSDMPANGYIISFTIVLVGLGVVMLILGIIYQISFMLQIRKEREAFISEGLLPSVDKYPISMTLIIALLLFLLGVTAIIIMILQANTD